MYYVSINIYAHKVQNTVRGKILEGENFGELMALKSLARKNLVSLLAVY